MKKFFYAYTLGKQNDADLMDRFNTKKFLWTHNLATNDGNLQFTDILNPYYVILFFYLTKKFYWI